MIRRLSLLYIGLCVAQIHAAGFGTTVGRSLVESHGARAFALGEAFSMGANDIAAFGYNPASLSSLKSGHASFMFQRGVTDESFGRLSVGVPFKTRAVGFSVGYFDGGDVTINEDGAAREVTAQQDLVLNMGLSQSFRFFSLGLTGKFLSTELAETERDETVAVDFGVAAPIGRYVRLGGALQNFGSPVRFREDSEDLPQIARVGLATRIPNPLVRSTVFFDAPYFLNENEWIPAVGLEMSVSLLSLRFGYRDVDGLGDFTVGTGIGIASAQIDYGVGLRDQADTQHRISLSMRFGQRAERVVSEADHFSMIPIRPSTTFTTTEKRPQTRQYYTVQPGDSLSIIAQKFFGDASQKYRIIDANKYLFRDALKIKPGQILIIQ